LEAEKLENLQKLTEQARSEIATFWDKCFYSAEQRQHFTPAADENYTENLLEIHEEELARLHVSLSLFSSSQWQIVYIYLSKGMLPID